MHVLVQYARSLGSAAASTCLAAALTAGCTVDAGTIDKTGLASCFEGAGVCADAASVPARQRPLLSADSCEAGQLCLPRRLARGLPAAVCASSGGVEGRCLLERIPFVAEHAATLPRSFCSDAERCVPCFDPFTGEATGACELFGDSGPSQPPRRFGVCCGDRGRCVPGASVDDEQRAQLGRDACAWDELCLPQTLLEQQAPASCDFFGVAEGRCLPSCLPVVQDQLDSLPQSSCGDGERCAPCFDPLSGEATGACELPGDAGPTMSPGLFATCCEGRARCLPSALIESSRRGELEAADCPPEQLCVPQAFLDDSSPRSCASFGSVEGRCLSRCLPAVAEQLDKLPASFCAQDERCVPCFDPLSGEASGACEWPQGRGTPSTPGRAAECCGGTGRCLARTLVDAEQRDKLAVESCAEESLCVPQALIDEVPPRTCRSVGAVEGRCLGACLPMITRQLDQLPLSTCAATERCAPCFDPFSGDATGACSLPGDSGPTEGAVTFDACCDGAGRCLPDDLVSAEQRSALGPDSCASARSCVPQKLIDGVAPAHCSSVAGAEGRCLPSCLPLIRARLDKLPKSVCADNERCAPCFDILTGEATGACSLPGDVGPTRPAKAASTCCDGAGVCLPSDVVTEDEAGDLPRDTCADAELCVPRAAAAGVGPASCPAVQGFEGRCLPECLPVVAAQGERVSPSSCGAAERCVPCFDPISAEATGACSGPGDPGPAEPPGVFAHCCSLDGADRGRCIPQELVAESERSLLSPESCPSDTLCVPEELATPEGSLSRCDSLGTAGACVPSCLLSDLQLALVLQGSCKSWQRCIPCSDLGDASGACN